MRCSELMKREVECVLEEDTIEEAARILRAANIGFLPVCDAERKVVGTLTDRDIAVRVAAENLLPAEVRVGEVMSRDVIACNPEDDLRDAEGLMAQHHISRIVTVDDRGTLAGVISLSDIVGRESARRTRAIMREVVTREARL
jgi:CBS domain-containing protein